MNPKDLFLAALDLTAEERAAFLAALEPQVRPRVEQLLKAYEAANDFLNPSLGPPVATQESVGGAEPEATLRLTAGPREGLLIAGRYTLEKRIGEGGMGEVWVARQSEPVQRRVALKLMKPGMGSRAILARFEAERQALALMDHPSIARVLDGGLTPDHRPYYVMELVLGQSLTDYCDQAKLTPRQRLELFVTICQAVQHAHQKGIVHRDLKPNNILVTEIDGRPVPKVIDFGVAKATGGKLTDESLHTDFGVIVGTLEYMSPEQAGFSGHDVDTRADIYSLGVILYELLTGLRPIDAKRLRKAALTEMVRIIREEEPSKPSTRLSTAEGLPSLAALRQTEPRKLMALLRGDLDWVVMKCLEKDRGRRYETANGLARDIQRYLADEAVEARPPSMSYRTGKFLKRYRGPVAAAALVLLTLVGGIIGTTWGLFDARQARAAEAERAEGERQAKLEAQKRLKQVEAGIGILFSIFDDLDLKRIKRGAEPLDAVLAKRLVGAAQQLEGESIGDPLLVANLQDKLGNTLVGLGYAPEAANLFQKSRDTRTKLQGPDQLETLVSMHNLAEAYRLAGRLQEAVALFAETVRLMSATVGDHHPVTLKTLGGQATALHDAGQIEASLPLREALLKRLQEVPGENETEILINLASLADAYQGAGKYSQSLPMYEDAIRRMEAHFGADHPETLVAMHNYGGALLQTGQPIQALPYMEKVFHRRRAKLGDEHPDTMASLANLAEGLQAASKADQAVPLLQQAFEQMKAKLGEDHPYTLTIMSNLASSYQRAGKMEPALTLWESCVRKMKLTKGDSHPDTLTVLNNLASGYQAAGKTLQALPLLEEAYQRKKEKLGPEHPLTLGGMNLLAEGHLRAGRPQQALPLFKDCLRLRREKLGPDHPDTLISMNNLGLCHRDLGRIDLALPLFKDALQGMKEKLGPEHFNTLTCMNNLALAYHGTGRLDLAMPLYEQALEFRERKFGPNHPDTLQSLGNLAAAYWMSQQPARARQLFEESLRRYEATLGRKHPLTLRIVGNLGILYKDSGRLEDALPLLEEVHQAAAQHPFLSFVSTALLDGYLKARKPDQARELTQSLLADARKKLPGNSADLGNSLAVYGMAFMELNAYAEAEPVLRDCLAIREKIQPEAWQRFSTMSVLGGALLGQKKHADAEPLLLKGYQGLKEREKTIPIEARSLRLREALQRLVDFYNATGKPEEEANWRKELDALPAVATPQTSPEKKQ